MLPVLEAAGVPVSRVRAGLDRQFESLPKVSGSRQTVLSPAIGRLLEHAEVEADRLHDEYVSTEHFLLGALDPAVESEMGRILREAGATRESVYHALLTVRGGEQVSTPDPEEKYQALAKYARDLTETARKGKLDPVIGRDEEIRRVIQVLSRRTKNNPVLIGEPGVGKTAIAEGLAQRIVSGGRSRGAQVPPAPRARPGLAPRGRAVPRPVRRPAQVGSQGSPALRRPGDPLHRRASHAGRRGGGGGRARRVESVEARARARRASLHRRHHAGRVPKADREGRGAGAALSARVRVRADRGPDDRHSPRPPRAIRNVPQGEDPGRGLGGRRRALPSLSPRPPASRQGDRPRGRGRVAASDRARQHAGRDRHPGAEAAPARGGAPGAEAREG